MESGLKLWGVMTASALVLPNGAPTLVKAAARLAKVVFHDRIQICDNVADEVEMNLAMDTGRRVIMMDGVYTIAAPATKAVVNVTLEGQGRGTLITLANAANCNVIVVGGDGWSIKNLNIDGNGANQASAGQGIDTNGHNDGLIEDVFVSASRDINIFLAEGSDYWRIISCDISSTTNGGYGVGSYKSVKHILIDNCIFNNNDGSGIATSETDASIPDNCAYDWNICNCTFISNGYCAIQIYIARQISVVNCHSEGTEDGDAYRFMETEECTLSASTSYEEGTNCNCVMISGCRWVSVTGCTFYHPQIDGVHLETHDGIVPSHITITGNTFYNIGEAALWTLAALHATTGDDVVFSDNVCFDDRGHPSEFDRGIVATGVTSLLVANNIFDGMTSFAVHLTNCDDAQVQDNKIPALKAADAIGIYSHDGDDMIIAGNRITCDTPIDINHANVVRCQIQGNNWEGSTNDPSYGAATTPRFNHNIDKNGAWWSVSDGQPTTRHFMLTARGGAPSTTDGCTGPTLIEYTTNDVDMYHLDFQQAAAKYAQWGEIPLPDDYDGGPITANFYWTGIAGAGTAIWALQGRAYADDDPIDAAWGGAQQVTDTFIAASDVHISSATAAITLAGSPAAGQLAQFRVYRNGGTKSEDARLIAVKVNYTGR